MPNNAKLGGILSIVSGGIGIFWMLMVIVLAIFMAVMPGLLGEDFYSGDDYASDEISPEVLFIIIAVVYGLMGIAGILVGALAIVGGVFALKKQRWGWALAGAIAGNTMFPLCGIPAVIFVSLGKAEFQSEPVQAAPMQKIVG